MASNPHPQNILHRKVTVGTTNNTTIIEEGHKVFGPYAPGISIVTLPTGNKKVIPLTSNTGEGAHFLKLTFPDPTSTNQINNSTLYVTFCRKNSSFTDGYQDYTTNLPSSYIDSLKSWIDNGRPPLQSSSVRFRKLTFATYGRETMQTENTLSFEVRISYTGVMIPQAPIQPTIGNVNPSGGLTGGGIQQLTDPR